MHTDFLKAEYPPAIDIHRVNYKPYVLALRKSPDYDGKHSIVFAFYKILASDRGRRSLRKSKFLSSICFGISLKRCSK